MDVDLSFLTFLKVYRTCVAIAELSRQALAARLRLQVIPCSLSNCWKSLRVYRLTRGMAGISRAALTTAAEPGHGSQALRGRPVT